MAIHLPPFIHPDADPILTDLHAEMPPRAARSILDAPGVADGPCGPVLSHGAPEPRFVDSPCGPVLAPGESLPDLEHCACCSQPLGGDHAGAVCPCKDGWL